MNNAKIIKPKEWVEFHCSLCGNCCRDITDKIMLEPLDAFNLAQYLKDKNKVDSIEDIYEKYAHPYMLDGYFPIFLLNSTEPDGSCVFLRNGRCTVYDGRPKVCRIYPFSVNTGCCGKSFEFYQCLDSHSGHYSGGKVLVKDWMYQNFSKDDREFMTMEQKVLPSIGHQMRKLSKQTLTENLFRFIDLLYYNYNLEQPFLPQYMENMRTLDVFLKDIARKGP